MVSSANFDHEKLDMLTKLVERFDPYQHRVRENAPSVAGRSSTRTTTSTRTIDRGSKALPGRSLAGKQNFGR
jgi:hypothetical protein